VRQATAGVSIGACARRPLLRHVREVVKGLKRLLRL
jgi:hypothetical protein